MPQGLATEPADAPRRPQPRLWRRPTRALSSLFRPERATDRMPEGRPDAAVLARDARYRRSLAVADMLSAGMALYLGAAVLGDDRLTWWWFLVLPIVVLVSKAIRLYDRDQYVLGKTTLDEAPALFQLATFYALLVWLADGTLIEGFLGRDQVLGLWGLFFALMLASRAFARTLSRAITKTERCLVVGDPRAADRLQASFDKRSSFNATVVGRVRLPNEESSPLSEESSPPSEESAPSSESSFSRFPSSSTFVSFSVSTSEASTAGSVGPPLIGGPL